MKKKIITLALLFSFSCVSISHANDIIPEIVVDESIRDVYEDEYLLKLIEDSKSAEIALQQQKQNEEKMEEEQKEQNLLKNESYSKFKDLQESNDEVYGWIRINNLVVDYPIMYSGDDKYLELNVDGEDDPNGAIFLDKNSMGVWGKVNLIHGHNMKSGEMFGMLDNYKDQDFAEKYDNVEIARDGVVSQYKVFSVIVADSDTEEIQYSFSKDDDFRKYVSELYERSVVDLDGPDSYDEIIILSTCSYQFNNAHTLVCAYNR